MDENDLTELKEWLRIDGTDDDKSLKSLIMASRSIIQTGTGVQIIDIKDNPDALELYKLLQKLIITDLYENKTGSSNVNPMMVSFFAQLEAYKLGDA